MLMINILKNSILKNLIILINGPILLINSKNSKFTLKKLKNINPLLNFLGLKLNNKIYSKNQIKNLKKLLYVENVFIFYKYIKALIKMPYYKFKSKKILAISK